MCVCSLATQVSINTERPHDPAKQAQVAVFCSYLKSYTGMGAAMFT